MIDTKLDVLFSLGLYGLTVVALDLIQQHMSNILIYRP